MTDETLLHRHVNPSWIQNGEVTSQAFRPTPKDNKCLSVYDGDQINVQGSWEHFTKTLGFKSAGVMAVTVKECSDQELQVHPDPETFKEHVLIDFRDFGENQIIKKAKRLKAAAVARDWLAEKSDFE